MAKDRKLIFISHANPEDNEFTLWLAARLASVGFLVWSDLTKLFGAEVFWDDIEDAIRNHAAKFVVVCSRVAQRKEGVLDEINLAITLERKEGIQRFVIPLRIDDLPFNDVRPNLARKNFVDFEGNWAEGLRQLLKVLERDSVPRTHELSARQTSLWIENTLLRPQPTTNQPQSLVSNRYEIVSLPENLYFHTVPISTDKVRSRFEPFAYPVYPYQNMIATFASVEDVNDFLPSWQRAIKIYRIPISAILNREPHSLPKLEKLDALNILSFLIRIAWDKKMAVLGLHCYEMADGKKAWFPSLGHIPDGWTRYVDVEGVGRRKRLVGRSEKRKVYWHFAAEVWPSIGQEPYLAFKPHVAFTENGKEPLPDHTRMHQLRRGFCKSWWNPRWRDLLLAYTTLISDEQGAITLAVGSKQELVVQGWPMTYESLLSLTAPSEARINEDESDAELDALSDEIELEGDEEGAPDILEESTEDHEIDGGS